MKDAENGANAVLTVNLEAQEIVRPDGGRIGFEVDPLRRHRLLNGLDDVTLTLKEDAAAITAFEKRRSEEAPWL